MCTRYVPPDQASIERAWEIGRSHPGPWARALFPRALGPFLRMDRSGQLELVVGQWGLIPRWAKSARLAFSTQNCRTEEVADKPAYRDAWRLGQRCIIPASSFDEPCWETGKNVWWRFERADAQPWGLAGLWNAWLDTTTGEVVESYTMLTVNADDHPLMARMHKPDPAFPPGRQDKRSVVAIERSATEAWLNAGLDEVGFLLVPPAPALIKAGPAQPGDVPGQLFGP